MARKVIPKRLALLALTGLLLGAAPGRLQGKSGAGGEETLCQGASYSNETYLYSIAIPAGVRCCRDPAPSPNHGCASALHGKEGSRLWVDGSYNTLDFASAEDALRFTVGSDLVAGTTLTVLRHEPTTLGGFEAVRMTLRISRQGEAAPSIKDLVIAVAPREKRGEVVYTVGWSGPEAEYAGQETLFSKIVASWRPLR